MYKPTLKTLEHDLNILISSVKPFFFSTEELQKLTLELLEETYNLINKLEEIRFKHNLSKLEHDRNNVKSYIDYYKSLQENATEQEDEDLASRYGFAHAMYELFQKNPSSAIAILRLNMIAMEELKSTPEFQEEYLSFLKEHNPDDYTKRRRHLLNLDLIVDIFNHLESYQIDKKTILKSASLRLFKFFNTVAHVQKRTLAKNIEHLFAPLGERISIDPKRAGKTRKIGSFQSIDLFDYQGNQKVLSKDIDVNKMFIDLLPNVAEKAKENGFDRQSNLLQLYKQGLEFEKSLSFLKP